MSTHEILAAVALLTAIGLTVAILHYVRSRTGAALLRRFDAREARRSAAGDVQPPAVPSAPTRRLTFVAYAPATRWDESPAALRCWRRVALDGGLPVVGAQTYRGLLDRADDEALAIATHRALIAACEEFCLPRSCENRPGVVEDLQLARELGLRIRFIEEE